MIVVAALECVAFSLLEPACQRRGYVFRGDSFTLQWLSLAWILGLGTIGALSRIWNASSDEQTQSDRYGAQTGLSVAMLTPVPLLLFDYVAFAGIGISPIRMHGTAAGIHALAWIPVFFGLVIAPMALLSGLRGVKEIRR